MPSFNAELLTPLSARRPTMRLTFTSDRPSERPLRIYLTLSRRVRESQVQRFPIYYRFLPPPQAEVRMGSYTMFIPNSREPSRLVLIIGPGVSVRLDTFRRLFQDNSSLILEIYRVQDPSLVPTIGRRFNAEYFLQRYRIDTNPPASYRTGILTSAGLSEVYFDSRIASPEQYQNYLNDFTRSLTLPIISVTDPIGDIHNSLLELADRQTPRSSASRGSRYLVLESPSVFEFSERNNGLIIEHPYSGQRLIIDCPAFHWNGTPRAERRDHEARFCWDIATNEQGITQVRVMKTPSVRVTLQVNFEMVDTSESRQAFRRRVTLPVFDVKDADFNVVPLPGNNLPWQRGRQPTQFNVILPSSVSWVQAITDVVIGFIPGVGDAVDLVEFVYALRSDEDRWGHPVSTFDKTLMGVGVVLSLVGPSIASVRHLGDLTSTARRTASMQRRLRTMEQPFNRILRRLQDAQLSQGDRRFIEQMSERLRTGARLTRQQLERAQSILRRLPECPV